MKSVVIVEMGSEEDSSSDHGRSVSDGGAHQEAVKEKDWSNDVFPYDLGRRPLPSLRRSAGSLVEIEFEEGPVALLGRRRVPGFGNPWFFADNDGQGFAAGAAVISFVCEACRTRARDIRSLGSALQAEGMPVPSDILARLDEAEARADTTPDAALALAVAAGEDLVRAETAWREGGNAKPDFTLGICLKPFSNGGQPFKDAVAETFNAATIPLTWGIVEPEPGKPRYDVIDEIVAWCAQQGIRMKGHALIWHSFWERDSWHKNLNAEEFFQRSCARAREIMTRYANQFDIIELINEPVQAGFGWRPVEEAIRETVAVHDIVRERSPRTRVMINFYDEEETWFAKNCLFPRNEQSLIPVREFIERCQARGAQVDILGLQRHLPCSLFDTRLAIEQWRRWFGLPIQMSELIIPSSAEKPALQTRNRPMQAPDRVWRDRPWSEQAQADWVAEFLPFFHVMPGVEGATFWGAADAMTLWHDYLIGHVNERYRYPWMAFQGLLREDFSRKPAYEQVRRLSALWNLKDRRQAAGSCSR